MDILDIVKRSIPDENEYLFGFSDLRGLIDEKYTGFEHAVTIGKKLNDDIIDSIASGPTMEYYNLYKETNRRLTELLSIISNELKTYDIESIVIAPTVKTGELGKLGLNSLTYGFSHKMAATRAGLGWIGKSDLFVSEKFGPRLRLATLLIDSKHAFSPPSIPVDESKCSTCSLCVEKCPAGASNGRAWNINIARDEFFNPYKCMDKCRELSRDRMNIDESICGICVSVCPVGKRNTGSK